MNQSNSSLPGSNLGKRERGAIAHLVGGVEGSTSDDAQPARMNPSTIADASARMSPPEETNAFRVDPAGHQQVNASPQQDTDTLRQDSAAQEQVIAEALAAQRQEMAESQAAALADLRQEMEATITAQQREIQVMRSNAAGVADAEIEHEILAPDAHRECLPLQVRPDRSSPKDFSVFYVESTPETEISFPMIDTEHDATTQESIESLLIPGGNFVGRIRKERINEKVFVKHMLAAGANMACSKLAATLANTPILAELNTLDVSEMTLQNFVYSRITHLFYAINPNNYSANQIVHNVHSVTRVQPNIPHVQCRVSCLPDAAVSVMSEKNLVMAMMELKVDDGNQAMDRFRCVLMTTVSLLSSRKRRIDTGRFLPVEFAIPFILGRGFVCNLYITRFSYEQQLSVGVPTIDWVASVDFSRDGVPRFIATVAVYLARIQTVCKQMHNEGSFRMMPTMAILTLKNVFPSREKTGSAGQGRGSSEAVIFQPGEPAAPHNAAQRGGLINNVEVLLSRSVQSVCLASPYYFVGRATVDGIGSTSVFCKVWREGDQWTDCNKILDEIRFLKEANAAGVPSPLLLEHGLTALNIAVSCGASFITTETFHVLVTQLLRDDAVHVDDLWQYSVSLVHGINKLHSMGVLHCDIKPGNVLWDSIERTANIIDFGLAQNEVGARSYLTTKKYQSPETMLLGAIHSKKSDAYCVGKTIQAVMALADFSAQRQKCTKNNVKMLKNWIELLVVESVEERMSLEDLATKFLSDSLLSPSRSSLELSTPPLTLCALSTISPSTKKEGATKESKASPDSVVDNSIGNLSMIRT